MRKLFLATSALALALGGVPGGASAQDCQASDLTPTVVSTDVTVNTTWSGLVILQQPIFVKNNAILTILPGTVVRGQPRSAAVVPGSTAGTPGTLVVTQNGRLVANASASNPIIMTTAAVDNNNDGIADDVDAPIGFEDEWVAGDLFLDDNCQQEPLAPLNKAGVSNTALWGGLVLLGHAPTNLANKCGVGYGKCTVEGLTVPGFPAADATYGGVLPHDNSGIVRFVSIRHAGDEIGNSNELNGLSMGGVGDGTIIENVEVYANFDDGFEWFGGTVNGKNLHVAYVGDDMFDADEGYTGVNQFLFGIMPFFNENGGTPYGSASGDKGCEFDGENFRPDNVAFNDNLNVREDVTGTVADPTPWPLSNLAVYNMTIIGSTPDAGPDFTPVSAAATNRGCQFRNGFAGDVFNSIVVNTGAETGIEVDTNAATSPPGFSTVDNANAGLINLVCSTLDDGAALAAQETTVVTNGNALAISLGGVAPGSNNAVNPAGFGLVNEDTTFDPTGNAAGKLVAALKPSPIDPHTAGGGFPPPPIAGCPAPRGTGIDAAATYRGAFATGAALWTNGWTTLSIADLL
jgi:hypothetical protein